MRASAGSTHEQYRTFRSELADADDQDSVVAVLFDHLPNPDGAAAALLETGEDRTRDAAARLLARRGPEPFWSDYLELCRRRQDLVSRIMRLSPHTLTLGDIHRHPRLRRRAIALEIVLSRHRLNDFFAVPAIEAQRPVSMALIAGADLDLRRSSRHLLSRMGMDALARIAEIRAAAQREAEERVRGEALRLTRRQFEIAHWLVAGKTDWEIGEILQISPKTVNYHVEQMKRRFGVRTRNQFVAAIVHRGGIAPEASPRDGAPL